MKRIIASSITALALVSSAHGSTILFDLIGTGGVGLLATNEPQPMPFPTNSSGGEVGSGISYDDVTKILTVNVGWGSSQGFNDLSSLANNSHIHGPTANPNGNNGTSDYTQTASVLFNLNRSSNAVTGGTFTSPSNTITLTAAQQIDLLNGKYYINVHTANNGGGEMRGFLVAVPEPSGAGLAVLGAGVMLVRRRRCR